MEITIKILAHILTAITSAALAVFIITHGGFIETPQKLVTIDATQALLGFIQTIDKDMPDDAYAIAVVEYQKQLEKEIVELAESQGLVVINAAVVLSGGTDITQYAVDRVLDK
ncbi:hypothetical protein A9Q96_09990 [Rhodobacterales bacterium 52_120_T64]|nr:hypothetical protein A9Q96_09990 [Rhodobacterales bacterium 52_120_T64]